MELITGNEGIVFAKEAALIDSIDANGHAKSFREDIRSAVNVGFKKQRINLRFAKCNPHEGVYDFGWLDEYMAEVFHAGVTPIVDCIHHTSLPRYLSKGFLDSGLEHAYLMFIENIANRYPDVRCFTLFNEMFTTLRFAGEFGWWHPYRHSCHAFVRMLINVGRAVSLATSMLEKIAGARFIYFEACEVHVAIDEASRDQAEHENLFRMLALDLILGQIIPGHGNYSFLLENGASKDDLNWFLDHPARIDSLGLDYYLHSTIAWRASKEGTVARPSEKLVGFCEAALQYEDYFQGIIGHFMLGETNIREEVAQGGVHVAGRTYDRITWLKFMVSEYEALKKYLGNACGEFGWYPFVSCVGWTDDLANTVQGKRIDPVGILDFDETSRERKETLLVDAFRRLATGEWSSKDIPAYRRSWLSSLPSIEKWDLQEIQEK